MSARWERLESELWETAGVLLVGDSSAVAIDPGITPRSATRPPRPGRRLRPS